MIAVKDLMTPIGSEASPGDTLKDVVATMRRNNHSCVVVTEHGRVVGILTERDLVGLLADAPENPYGPDQRVKDVMVADPVCVNGHTSLLDALKLARANKIRHLPVLDDKQQLIGMVTHTDMINVYVDILEEQTQLINDNTALRAQSLEDPLLRIGNRRAMEGDLVKVAATARRTNQPFTIALIDLDYFKPFNDHYGHVDGDKALQAVVAAICSAMRVGDSLYRYGGEELLMLMPNTDLTGAYLAVERARDTVLNLSLPHEQSPYRVLTLSAGLASDEQLTLDQLIASADKALYMAKAQGRNRVGPQPE